MKTTIILLLVATGGMLSASDLGTDSSSLDLTVSLPEVTQAGGERPEGPPPPPPGKEGEDGERPEGPPPPPPGEDDERPKGPPPGQRE